MATSCARGMEIEPHFYSEDEKFLFFHWFWGECENSQTCLFCLKVIDILKYATENLLVKCIKTESETMNGCDLCSFYVNKISGKCAKDILSGKTPLSELLDTHFPRLRDKLTPEERVILQLVRAGGLEIFCVLLRLFQKCMNKGGKNFNFVLLCFHISGLFSISPIAAEKLWAETLRRDVTLILLSDFRKQADFDRLLRVLNSL